MKSKHIQLFQLTLSDRSIKLEDKTARLCGILFWINLSKPAMPRLSRYGEEFDHVPRVAHLTALRSERGAVRWETLGTRLWRVTMASDLDERNFRISSRWGSSCFEDGKSGVRPHCHEFHEAQENISELCSVPVLTDKWTLAATKATPTKTSLENITLFYLCYLLALQWL